MDARTKCLRRAEDSTVFLENFDRSVKPGSVVIYISRPLDKITYTCLFVLVILSIQEM
jgi:hypothetical protein